MSRRLLPHLIVQVLILVASCCMAGSLAPILAGALGGTAMGVAPRPVFALVESIVCPEGTKLEYSEVTRSYHRPGESQPYVECVSQNGTRQEVLAPAIASVLGLSFLVGFLVVFLPVFVPLAVLGFIVTRLVLARRRVKYIGG